MNWFNRFFAPRQSVQGRQMAVTTRAAGVSRPVAVFAQDRAEDKTWPDMAAMPSERIVERREVER